MSQLRTNLKVDAYLSKVQQWREEMEKLRMIILGCQLTEELKWGVPCYTFQQKNLVLIHGFKEYRVIPHIWVKLAMNSLSHFVLQGIKFGEALKTRCSAGGSISSFDNI